MDGVPALITNWRGVWGGVVCAHRGEISLATMVVNERSKKARKNDTARENTITIPVNTKDCRRVGQLTCESSFRVSATYVVSDIVLLYSKTPRRALLIVFFSLPQVKH